MSTTFQFFFSLFSTLFSNNVTQHFVLRVFIAESEKCKRVKDKRYSRGVESSIYKNSPKFTELENF